MLIRCISLPLLILSFIILPFKNYSQQTVRRLTLEESLEIARKNSPDALNSKQAFRSSFWQYRQYKGRYLPSLTLNGTVPDLQRAFQLSRNIDGSVSYLPYQYVNYSADLSLDQRIGFTGGTLFLRSGLQRLDNTTDSTVTSYLTTPINIGYTQPVFQYNPFKWERKIEPLLYDVAKKKYLEDLEQINLTTTDHFFNLLQAQIDKRIALTNRSNYDTLYRIAKGRYQVGKIAENDLLLLELNLLKAQAAVETADLNLDNAQFFFKSYLRIRDTIPVELSPPANIEFFTVNPVIAIKEANMNSSASMNFTRRKLEAARDVNQAKMDNRFDATIKAVFGYNGSEATLPAAYKNQWDQEQVTIGLTIPILDWGVARGKIKMAESQQEIVLNNIEQETMDYDRNIYLKVMQFNMQRNQLRIAAKADTVAKKSYDVTKGRYLIGKITSILELNNAQIENDSYQKAYLSALQTYWRSYFELRKLTLFDFRQNSPLNFNFQDLKP